MALAPDELTLVRLYVGEAEPPTDADLSAYHDSFGGLVGVVRAVWAARLSALLADPASFSIGGEYSQSTAANIKAYEERLKSLGNRPADSDDLPPLGGSTVVQTFPLSRLDDRSTRADWAEADVQA